MQTDQESINVNGFHSNADGCKLLSRKLGIHIFSLNEAMLDGFIPKNKRISGFISSFTLTELEMEKMSRSMFWNQPKPSLGLCGLSPQRASHF